MTFFSKKPRHQADKPFTSKTRTTRPRQEEGLGGQPAQMDRPPRRGRASEALESVEPQRLQKILAAHGVGSRREIEEAIVAGQVIVNGEPAELGQKVGPRDQIRVRGKRVFLKFAEQRVRVLLYHKPTGEIVSQDDPEGRPTVFEHLPRLAHSRWVAVGRLDFNSEGLMLFTTSGALANRLMHPRYQVDREYAVRILGRLTQEQSDQLVEGILLEDGPARFLTIEDRGGEGANHWYHVTLPEGRNREVRRIFEALDLQVSRLIRVRYGSVVMPPQLKRGQITELSEEEVEVLLQPPMAAEVSGEPLDELLPPSVSTKPLRTAARRSSGSSPRPTLSLPQAKAFESPSFAARSKKDKENRGGGFAKRPRTENAPYSPSERGFSRSAPRNIEREGELQPRRLKRHDTSTGGASKDTSFPPRRSRDQQEFGAEDRSARRREPPSEFRGKRQDGESRRSFTKPGIGEDRSFGQKRPLVRKSGENEAEQPFVGDRRRSFKTEYQGRKEESNTFASKKGSLTPQTHFKQKKRGEDSRSSTSFGVQTRRKPMIQEPAPSVGHKTLSGANLRANFRSKANGDTKKAVKSRKE